MFYISELAYYYLIIEKLLKTKATCLKSLDVCVIPFNIFWKKNLSKHTDQETVMFALGCY